MPYARQTYSLAEVERMIDGVVNVSVAQGGSGRAAPDPHGKIHAPTDELHRHELFQKARVTSGDVPVHSVVANTAKLKSNLLTAMNSVPMQEHLGKLDPAPPRAIDPTWHEGRQEAVGQRNTQAGRNPVAQKDHIWVNVNFNVGQGLVNEYSNAGATVATRQYTYQCLGMKLMANPNNRDLPILQTCVPTENVCTNNLHIMIGPA